MRRSFTYCVSDSSSISRVAWPMRCAPHDVNGLAHRRRVGAFAGVTGAREIVLARVRERRGVRRRRIPELAAGEIEPDDAAMLVRDREPRELERHVGRQVAKAADDDARHRAAVALGALESAERRLDRLAEREAAARR